MSKSTTQSEQKVVTSSLSPSYLIVLRIFFAACIALGPLTFFLYGILNPAVSLPGGQAVIAANAIANSTTNQLHLIFGVAASFFLPIGYLGMSLLALRRTPWLGTISLLFALPSWTPLSALIGLDALTLDIAQMGNSASFANLWDIFNGDGVMSTYLITYAACHLLSTILLGVALGRARLIPVWAATALVVSSPLTIVGFIIHLRILLNIVLALLAIGSLPAALAMLKPASKGGWAPLMEEANLTRI